MTKVHRQAHIKIARIEKLFPVVVGVLCLVPFAPLLVPDDAVITSNNRDYAVMHLPLAQFAREELVAGRLPLWNPYLACGQPLQAAPQAMLFYPLATPLCVLFGANGGLKVAVFIHAALCFAGTYLLARQLELSRYGAAYAALVTTWSGAMLGHVAEGHVGAVFATALAPWFFLALRELLRSPNALSSVKLAAVGSLCSLVAQPQVFYYTLVAAIAWAVGSLICGAASRQRLPAVCWGICAAVLAMLIAAVQLAPAIELLRDGMAESERGALRFAAMYALDGADAARLLMPYLNGTPFAGVAQFDGSDHYHERVIYLGVAAPLLALYGLSRAGVARWQWAAAWSVIVALAIAFGPSTPVFALVSKALPGLLLFRCPGRVFLIGSLPAALLAGRGLDALASGEPRAERFGQWRLVVLAMTAVGIPAYAALKSAPSLEWPRYMSYVREHLLGELSLWGILLSETLIVISLSAGRRLRGLPVWLCLSAVAALDLGYFNVGNFRVVPREDAFSDHDPPPGGNGRFADAFCFQPSMYVELRYSRLTSAAMYERWPTVGTYDGGVLPRATARLYQAIGQNALSTLALAACRFACLADGRVTENPGGALPRIRFVPDGVETFGEPLQAVAKAAEVDRLKAKVRTAVLVQETPCELRIDVTAPTGGWLVVADTFYPGWICGVDGQCRPIEVAHEVFRRVRIQSGRHAVVMTYDPLSFRIGLLGTCAGICIAIAVATVPLVARR